MTSRRTWSLGAKLAIVAAPFLTLTLLAIAATLWVSWQLEGGAAAVNEAGRLRMQSYRVSLSLVAGDRDALLDLEASRTEYARLPGGRGFVVVRDTSHVGVSWSSGVAAKLASFAQDPTASRGFETIEP